MYVYCCLLQHVIFFRFVINGVPLREMNRSNGTTGTFFLYIFVVSFYYYYYYYSSGKGQMTNERLCTRNK